MPRDRPLRIQPVNGDVHEHSYIIKLKEGTHKGRHFDHIDRHIRRLQGHSDVTHNNWRSELFHGYAGKFSGASLDALRHHDDIEYIEHNAICSEDYTQEDAPWGLGRICSDSPIAEPWDPLTDDFTYVCDSSSGDGVDIYMLDSGVYCDHDDFEGRAEWGANFTPDSDDDNRGHGTHCAGTAAGARWGVAKNANIIAVKVLKDNGKGATADIIDGINWVIDSVLDSNKPSIISMSIGGPRSHAFNHAAYQATTYGIHFVTSAGNDDTDAENQSPASAPGVLTVGASNIYDARWHKSNYGRAVDIFAPGEAIRSCGIRGPRSATVKNGTSMATPHVAGFVACYISRMGDFEPREMIRRVRGMGLSNVLDDIPRGTTNLLLRNGQRDDSYDD